VPKQPAPKPLTFEGPGRKAAVIGWNAVPAKLTLALRPSTSAPGRVRAVLVQPLADPTNTDGPVQAVPFADFRLEMN
jgi:hypothetical protein